jgi:uncharacterized alpha-E superfamily protein
LWKAHTCGLRISEVPITFIERVHGESKMSSGIVKEAILRVTLWGFQALPARLRGDHRAAVAAASAARLAREEADSRFADLRVPRSNFDGERNHVA